MHPTWHTLCIPNRKYQLLHNFNLAQHLLPQISAHRSHPDQQSPIEMFQNAYSDIYYTQKITESHMGRMGRRSSGYPHNFARFTDADFAGDIDDQKLTMGWIFTFNRTPVLWASKKQGLITRSSMEAKLVARLITSAKGIWLIRVGRDSAITSPQSCYSPTISPSSLSQTAKSTVDIHNMHTYTLVTKITEWALLGAYMHLTLNTSLIYFKTRSNHSSS